MITYLLLVLFILFRVISSIYCMLDDIVAII